MAVTSCIVAGCPNTPGDKTITVVLDLPGMDEPVERVAPICDDCLAKISEPAVCVDFSFGFTGFRKDPREVDAQ